MYRNDILVDKVHRQGANDECIFPSKWWVLRRDQSSGSKLGYSYRSICPFWKHMRQSTAIKSGSLLKCSSIGDEKRNCHIHGTLLSSPLRELTNKEQQLISDSGCISKIDKLIVLLCYYHHYTPTALFHNNNYFFGSMHEFMILNFLVRSLSV